MAGEFYYGATDGSYHDVYVHYGTGALQENDVVYPRSPLKTTTTMDTEAYFDHNKILPLYTSYAADDPVSVHHIARRIIKENTKTDDI